MSEELFEKYLQNALTEEEQRRLSALLAENEGKQAFVDFLQEWSLLGEVSREMTASEAPLPARARERVRPPAVVRSSARGWWIAGLAASFFFVLGLILVTQTSPPASTVVHHAVPVGPAPTPKPIIVQEAAPEKAPVPAPAPRKLVAATPRPEVAPVKPEAPPAPRKEPRPVPAPRPTAPTPPAKAPARAVDEPRPGETVAAIAVLLDVEGDVRVLSGGREIEAKEGMACRAAQGLRTGANGRAVVRFPDETLLELAPGTTVSRIMERDPEGRTRGKSVDLLAGAVTADVTRQPSGRPMMLRTALAEATVLGTRLTFTSEPETTSLEVWKGRVRLKRRADGASIVLTGGHRGIVARGTALRPEVIVLADSFQDGVAPDPGYAGTRDTHINEVKPDENVGTLDELEADGDETGGKSIWSLLRWDISSIPRDAVVRSVVITLNVQGVSKGIGYRMYGARRPWVEAEATWKQFAAGRPWRSAGARSIVDRNRARIAEFAPRQEGATGILLNPEGVALVQSWVRAPEQNHGILIGSGATTDGFKFDARETSKPTRRPRLTVTYTLGARR